MGRVVTAAVEVELRGTGLVCVDVRKVMLLVTQSINELWRASQLCPRTMAQEPSVRIDETRGRCTSGARDAASATQAERCALHHMRVLYLSDGRLAVLRRRRGGNLVDIRTSCI